jgi:hypothetical protein
MSPIPAMQPFDAARQSPVKPPLSTTAVDKVVEKSPRTSRSSSNAAPDSGLPK